MNPQADTSTPNQTKPARLVRFGAPLSTLVLALSVGWSAGTVSAQRIERLEIPSPAGRLEGSSVALPSPDDLRTVQIDSTLRQLVQQLDDPSYVLREEATRQLIEYQGDRRQFYALLSNEALTAEQRYRLLAVLQEHLVRTPRGALGIRMQPQMFNAAPAGAIEIRIDGLLPGLPAERVLQIGDRIVRIDGKELFRTDDLQYLVQSKRPGDKVHLTVKRTRVDQKGAVVLDANNQPVTDELAIELELGSADLLQEQPGASVQPSRVLEERLAEARTAATAFAPKPRLIEIEGDVRLLSMNHPQPAVSLQDAESSQIDRHPHIQSLLLDLQRISDGTLMKTKELQLKWIQQLSELRRERYDPVTPPERQAYLQRVIERYADLMQ